MTNGAIKRMEKAKEREEREQKRAAEEATERAQAETEKQKNANGDSPVYLNGKTGRQNGHNWQVNIPERTNPANITQSQKGRRYHASF
jgi:hypothetical protein